VTRLFDGGRVMPHHVRNAGTVRGLLTIKQEDDHVRHRTTLVARLTPQHQIGSRVVPPLYDVVLIASTGEVWTLAGYERVTSGALQQEYFLGQSWLVTPAPLEVFKKGRGRVGEARNTSGSQGLRPYPLDHPRECALDVRRFPILQSDLETAPSYLCYLVFSPSAQASHLNLTALNLSNATTYVSA